MVTFVDPGAIGEHEARTQGAPIRSAFGRVRGRRIVPPSAAGRLNVHRVSASYPYFTSPGGILYLIASLRSVPFAFRALIADEIFAPIGSPRR